MTSLEADLEPPQSPLFLSEGVWDESTKWEFYVDTNTPPVDLCTAVCCVVTHDNQLVLVRNKRGWELPAGKIESGEAPHQAVQREVHEESCVQIENPQYFGYKKITSQTPKPRHDDSTRFYPFPHSYVVFYYAKATSFKDSSRADDIMETIMVSYEEALQLLAEKGQYANIIEYLVQEGKITLLD